MKKLSASTQSAVLQVQNCLKKVHNTEDTYSDTIPPRDLQKDAKRYSKCTSILKQSFSDGNSFLKMYSKLSNSLLKTGVNSTIFNECFCIDIFCPLSRILY